MKDGRLSKRDMTTLDNAWRILSRWTEWQEEHTSDVSALMDDYEYDMAMSAVTGLCEFITNYED